MLLPIVFKLSVSGSLGRARALAGAGALVLALVLLFPALTAAQQSLPDTIDAIRPSVVGIGTYQHNRSPVVKLFGTGFVIGDGQHVITNMHVIPPDYQMDRGERLVVLPNGDRLRQALPAEALIQEQSIDLAVLRFDGDPLPAMGLGRSSGVREGQTLAFTGYPIGMALGLHPITHRALVAAIVPTSTPAPTSKSLNPRNVRQLRDAPENVFQLDATAFPGNSGSPLYLPDSGEVVGVINRVYVGETRENLLSAPTSISYAIPIDLIRSRLDSNGIRY